jgi:hypothetical protein
MNILHIIGNGFDINLGMNTRYSDFYKYYQKIHSENKSINNLKNAISSGLRYWSDLEIALGNYTENLISQTEFDEVYKDILINLAEYLEKVESNYDFQNLDVEKFFDCLGFPENKLSQAAMNQLTHFKSNWSNHQWNVNIITLNYTTSIEKLIGEKQSNIHIGKHHRIGNIVLNRITHLHGYYNKDTVMGVNDVSQIANPSFQTNQDIVEAIVKPDSNKALGHTNDNRCIQQISQANLICIFGSSIGDTDKIWWELIGNQLKKDCQLIIFNKGAEIDPRTGYLKPRLERVAKDNFLARTLLKDEEKKKYKDKIYVGINTTMFDIL